MKKIGVGRITLLGIIFFNLYFFTPYIYRSWVKINKLEEEQQNIQQKISITRNKIEEFNKKIDTLEDGFEREKIARNKLQMVKEKEEIYRFINKK